MPAIGAAATTTKDFLEAHEGLTNEIGPLVIVEDRNLQLAVIWGLMYGETKLLIPN